MPLTVDQRQQWPPRWVGGLDLEAIRKDIAEADAWYSGDPAKLGACYSDAGAPTVAERAAFWRRGNTQGTASTRLHLPVAADVAATGADLLFGQFGPGNLIIPEAHDEKNADMKAAQETEAQIGLMLSEQGLGSKLIEGAEIGGGLGGVFLVPGWDHDAAQHPLLAVVHPDHVVPTFRAGILTELTLWSIVHVDGEAIWRHLEHHDATGIENRLYVGTRLYLGSRVDLAEHASTRGIADRFADGHVPLPDGVTGLMPRYVPNMLPNPKHRQAAMGRSDTAEVVSLMAALDETWTSWMRDIRLAKGRLLVAEEFLGRTGRGQGATFDTEQEIFSPLRIDPESMKAGAGSITIAQFAIRADDHAKTAKGLIEQIVRSAGYSPQSLGLEVEGGGIQTATEIEARSDQSERTNTKKQAYWEAALPDVLHTMLCIGVQEFGWQVTPMRPRIEWPVPDQDPQDLATTIELLERAKAVSTKTKVQMLHPDWEATEVDAEVAAINSESGALVENPTGGVPGGAPLFGAGEDEEEDDDDMVPA